MYDNINRLTEMDVEKILAEELGEKYTKYRKMWKSVTRDDFPKFPLHIDFEMNDLCNQSCVMCPRNESLHPKVNYTVNTKAIIKIETFKKIIDEGSQKGLQSINLGAFAEPLIHKEVFDMVRYAHEKGIIDTRLISNGLLLRKYKEEIFDSKLRNLFISLDAFSKDKYEQIRGHGYEQIRENLIDFVEERNRRGSRLPIVRVSFVDMEINRDEKEDFINFWRDKVDMIDIQVYDDFNVDINAPFNLESKKKWDCFSPWARVAVLANGNILPCCSFFGINIPIGNVKDMTIEEAWNSKKMKEIRYGVLNDNNRNCSVCQRVG